MSGLAVAFWIFAGLSVLGAVLVVTNRNPVASVLFLVLTFFSLAGLFVTLQSHFLAAIQILVYAGAIMVLFLFVVMLLNLGRPQWFDIAGAPLWLIGGLLGAAFVAALVGGGLPVWETAVRGPGADLPRDVLGSPEAVGTALYTAYYLPFMVTALLLLVAMVGAVVIARRER